MQVNIGKYPKDETERVVSVEIEDHDLWNLDLTLALIIHPALVKFKENAHSMFYVDDEDLPLELRTDSKEDKDWIIAHNWVLDELIWTFDYILKEDNLDFNEDDVIRSNNGLKLFGKYYRSLWD